MIGVLRASDHSEPWTSRKNCFCLLLVDFEKTRKLPPYEWLFLALAKHAQSLHETCIERANSINGACREGAGSVYGGCMEQAWRVHSPQLVVGLG